MLEYIMEQDYRLVLGSTYPNDPYIRLPQINLLYLKTHLHSSDIVILHDRPWTVPMLEKLLPWIQEKGWKCVTLDY